MHTMGLTKPGSSRSGSSSLPYGARERRGRKEGPPSFEPHRLGDARIAIAEAIQRLDGQQVLEELGLLETNEEVMGEVRVALRRGDLAPEDVRAMVRMRFEGLLLPLCRRPPAWGLN